MKPPGIPLLLCLLPLAVSGCTTAQRIDYIPPQDRKPIESAGSPALHLARDREEEILSLDPDHLTDADVRGILSRAPAPRIINVHGGRWPVYKQMVSFSKFLEGMGYPESRLRNPGDGTYSFSGYVSSRKLAGAVAWYYEREGLRPMMIGHSLGGFQTIRVLHQLAGNLSKEIPVWNPVTRTAESRCTIVDPITGDTRPVVGLSLCYASAIGAGGMTRLMPNTWTLTGRLRNIPPSVDAFTGYYMGLDLTGGDFAGFGPANCYNADGPIEIRNVRLPNGYPHGTVPSSEHLLASEELVQWINNYTPTNRPRLQVDFNSDSRHILFAADIWHDIRRHWVLELQRVIRAKRALRHEP